MLVLIEYYLPAYRAGGPVRSLANLIERLGDEIDFRVVAGDRDRGDSGPFSGIALDTWVEHGRARHRYVSRRALSIVAIREAIRSCEHDVLYLNSLFSRRFSIEPLLLRRAGLLPEVPVVLAPRGELNPGALGLKSRKKRLFLSAARRLGLHRGLHWMATNPEEVSEIRQWFGAEALVHLAPNLATADGRSDDEAAVRRPKRAGALRLAYLSRVTPKKNLLWALDVLAGVTGEVGLDILGPIADPDYWERCQARIARLPPNVSVHYRGPVPFGTATRVLAGYDAMLLPTLGENFGHAILEALAAGTPVLISDTTPWRHLSSRGAGWDLALGDERRWQEVIEGAIALAPEAHARMSSAAHALATEVSEDASTLEASRELFARAWRPVPAH